MIMKDPVLECVERVNEARAAGPSATTRDLVALLSERHPVYTDLGANIAVRLRGYVLASFQQTGLPHEALPFIIEALESAQEPYLVAAAARALRGAPRAEPWMLPMLERAAKRMRNRDDTFSLEEYGPKWPVDSPTTTMTELRQTLAWAGEPHEDSASRACCSAPAHVLRQVHVAWDSVQRRSAITATAFEDQDGLRPSPTDLFTGKPSIVGFFYTRCANPLKCSRTVTALGDLQRQLDDEGLGRRVRILAITYDPAYDGPERIHKYAEVRGFAFDADNRALRATQGFDALVAGFDLHATFTDVTVSQHATELFIVDTSGRIAASFQRLQWQPEDVMRLVREHLSEHEGVRNVTPGRRTTL
jgi:protein SCO1/2